ncbi:MAG: putative ABC transporter permease [Lachnospiraceae bacterium]|nr:putative ABC transporter permease [Lachnospiraceae bacterium]
MMSGAMPSIPLPYGYTIAQWMFFFFFYSFFGWVWECFYVSVQEKPPHFVNRGFMRGPFLPLYGCGGVMMMVVSAPFQHQLIWVFIAGFFGATILELVTGILMEALFKVRYWDYEGKFLNFHGYTCFEASVAWGVMTVLMDVLMHPGMKKLIALIPEQVLSPMTNILFFLCAVDFGMSFKAAIDLRNVLVRMEKLAKELEKIPEKIVSTAGTATAKAATIAGDATAKAASIAKEAAADTLTVAKEVATTAAGAASLAKEKATEAAVTAKEKATEAATVAKEKATESAFGTKEQIRYRLYWMKQASVQDFFMRNLMLGNPGMKSEQFKLQLEELKKAMNAQRLELKDKRKNKKNS